jgi:Leucine-rich repeat (LRR) protein
VLNRYVGLFQRNQELIDNHRAELIGPLMALPADVRVEFRRGFVSEVELHASDFNQHRLLLAAVQPLPRVRVTGQSWVIRIILGFDGFEKDRIPPNPQFHLVRAIRVHPKGPEDYDTYEGEDSFEFRPQDWPRLEELDVTFCWLGDVATAALLRESSLPALVSLDLSSNELSDAVVDSLLDTSLPRQLKRLVLGGNDITDVGALALAHRWPTGDNDRLENLNLRFTHIGQAGQAALLRRFGGRVDLF